MNAVETEVVAENQLQVIVKESGLEPTKAQRILDEFQDYFQIASKWETTAKSIVVTDAAQVADMKMARIGRLELREKRIAVEKTRKEMKETALREGKAIDGIANVLKALIVPIEEYLEKQEKFVEIQEAAKAEARRIEGERLLAEQEAARLKAEAEERERVRLENERLKAEAIEREKAAQAERERQAKILAEQQAKADAERKAQEEILRKQQEEAARKQKAAEEQARKEREAQAAKLAEEQKKREDERIAAEKEKARLEALLANQVTCPKCGHKFTPPK